MVFPKGSSADVLSPYNEEPAENGVLLDPYWKSKKNTSPEGKFIGCTDTNSCAAICPNTFLTNGKATPAHCPPTFTLVCDWNVPPFPVPPLVCDDSTTSCLAWFSRIRPILFLWAPSIPSNKPVLSHLLANLAASDCKDWYGFALSNKEFKLIFLVF